MEYTAVVHSGAETVVTSDFLKKKGHLVPPRG